MDGRQQLQAWVRGESYHNDANDQCCPDFSCCDPTQAWDVETRELFFWAFEAGRLDILKTLNSGAVIAMWKRRGYTRLLSMVPKGTN